MQKSKKKHEKRSTELWKNKSEKNGPWTEDGRSMGGGFGGLLLRVKMAPIGLPEVMLFCPGGPRRPPGYHNVTPRIKTPTLRKNIKNEKIRKFRETCYTSISKGKISRNKNIFSLLKEENRQKNKQTNCLEKVMKIGNTWNMQKNRTHTWENMEKCKNTWRTVLNGNMQNEKKTITKTHENMKNMKEK